MKPTTCNIGLTMEPKTNNSHVLLAVGASQSLLKKTSVPRFVAYVTKAHLYCMLANESWQALLAAVATPSA
ncbi:hypothetical protein Tco_0894881 [Tanacetum coccineum]|uniref:Uncharacterized protein n=1 Tax=Tanacetum coccineum TaxID=301880 RepID=A0ABQ5CJ95_9ASTR